MLHHRLGQLGLGHVLRCSPECLHTRSSGHENASSRKGQAFLRARSRVVAPATWAAHRIRPRRRPVEDNTTTMKTEHWPLFGLRVDTPRLTLRYPDDDDAVALAELGAHGVHDPGWMPFSIPWTDVEPPLQQRYSLQHI